MSFANEHSVGRHLTSLSGGAGTATAAGTGDATEVNGPWGDRTTYGSQSCVVVITYKAVLAEDKTLSFAGNLQDATAAAGTGAADFGTAFTATVVATGPSGGATVEGTYECLLTNLAGARAFIRAQITPDLSNTATDTLTWSAAIIMPKSEGF